MARIAAQTTNIVNTDTTHPNAATFYVFDAYVNIQEAIGGLIEAKWAFATTASASKSMKFYLLFSENGADYDLASKDTAQCVATFAVPTGTGNTQVSIPLDAGWLAGKYCKLAYFCDEANNKPTFKSIKFIVKKAV